MELLNSCLALGDKIVLALILCWSSQSKQHSPFPGGKGAGGMGRLPLCGYDSMLEQLVQAALPLPRGEGGRGDGAASSRMGGSSRMSGSRSKRQTSTWRDTPMHPFVSFLMFKSNKVTIPL